MPLVKHKEMIYKIAQCHEDISFEKKHNLLKHQHLNDAKRNGYVRTKSVKVSVTVLSHVYNTLVQRKRCSARCKMQIRNPVVCDARKGSLATHKPLFVE